MAQSKLLKVSYKDSANGIRLTNYADTLIFREDKPSKPGDQSTKTLAAIRFGGYPEQVRAMADAIYGGGDIEAETKNGIWTLKALTKQYHRQASADGVYAEATLIVRDDDAAAKLKSEAAKDDEEDGQEEIELPPRTYYILCPPGDDGRLFEEIDKKVSVPLIPEYKDFLLAALKAEGILFPLTVWSCSQKFDAWALRCSKDDCNVADVLEKGLKSGAIRIPGSENADNSVFERVTSVTQYLKEFGVSMANKIKARFNPLFDPAVERLSDEVTSTNANVVNYAGYSLYDAQLACVEALKRKTRQRQPAIIVAECGSGKTKIGASALYAAHAAEGKQKSFNIVMCPSHMTKKWVREVEETIPNSFGGVIHNISEFRLFYAAYERDNRTAFAVISKEKARDGYMKGPSVFWNKRRQAFLCPRCYSIVEMDLIEDGVPYRVNANAEYFLNENNKNHKCESCGEVLWAPLDATRQGEWVRIGEYGFIHRKFARHYLYHRRVHKSKTLSKKIREVASNPDGFFTARAAYRAYPLSTYINHYMQGKIDGFLADELHQYAQNSGQGDAMAEVAAVSGKVIGMTATLINGYSSGIFHLLWRLFSRFMLLDLQKFEDPGRFNKEYGVTETVYDLRDDGEEEYNANRRTMKVKARERLLPGVSPLVYARFLLEHAVFLSLMDMGKELPEYEEFPIPLDMTKDVSEEYAAIHAALQEAMKSDPKLARKIQSAALNLLTVYPDQPYGHPPIMNPLEDEKIIITPRDSASPTEKQPKDLKLLELVEKKMQAGENVLIYTSWVRIDTQEKLKKWLHEAGYKTAVLTVSVAPDRREQWVTDKVADGVRVLITNPSLVETGLDLNDFTTLIYYNIGYNLFTLRQSSRRSWRINQTAPRIEVYFFYYKNTIQERALDLMASKLAAAGLIEGQVTDEGLAAMSDCRDLTSQLARELTKGIRSEVEDLAGVFKRMAVLKTEEEKKTFAENKAALSLPETTRVSEKRPEHQSPAWNPFAEAYRPDVADSETAPKDTLRVFPQEENSPPAYTGGFVFSTQRRTQKSKTAVQVEDQLSLFDQTA